MGRIIGFSYPKYRNFLNVLFLLLTFSVVYFTRSFQLLFLELAVMLTPISPSEEKELLV